MMEEYPLIVTDRGDPKDYIQKYTTNVGYIILYHNNNNIMLRLVS